MIGFTRFRITFSSGYTLTVVFRMDVWDLRVHGLADPTVPETYYSISISITQFFISPVVKHGISGEYLIALERTKEEGS